MSECSSLNFYHSLTNSLDTSFVNLEALRESTPLPAQDQLCEIKERIQLEAGGLLYHPDTFNQTTDPQNHLTLTWHQRLASSCRYLLVRLLEDRTKKELLTCVESFSILQAPIFMAARTNKCLFKNIYFSLS